MSQASSNPIALVGMYPPPTTGAAKNNQILFDDLASVGAAVEKLSTSGNGTAHRRSLRYHFGRLASNISVLTRLLRFAGRGGTFYIVPDGGLGMVYSLVHILLGRLIFKQIVIHHRSFLYIDFPTALMASITAMTRSMATHVFLSDRMGECFENVYGPVTRITVSNAHYVVDDIVSSATSRADNFIIGHLSNLCREKGVEDVIAVFERLARSGAKVELRLAGKPINAEVQASIERLQSAWPDQFLYVGPIYGEAKRNFYRGLNVFLFPSHHPQEAQPNVVFEALAAGVPVLATPRACIPDMLGGARGGTSPSEPAFIDWCESELRARLCRDDLMSKDFSHELRLECTEAQQAYGKLKQILMSVPIKSDRDVCGAT